MKAMLVYHQTDVRYLEQLSRQGRTGAKAGTGTTQRQKPGMTSTADVSNVAQELLPTVKHHLQMAQEIEKNLQKANRK